MMLLNLFYYLKPLIPRRIQISLRRARAAYKRKLCKDFWPIYPAAAKKPESWKGWPDQKRFAIVLQHDVDAIKGVINCRDLMDVEMRLGFRSLFCFVPEDYVTPFDLRQALTDSGFEIGIHGLTHDEKLFKNKSGFFKSATRINAYLKEWGAVGFSTPSMIRDLSLIAELEIEHGCSTFDTDPFEPQSEGMGTIFPFFASNVAKTKTYVEHPYTLPQDHNLFIILGDKDIKIWKEKLDWIAENGGMAYLNSHPDYMNFKGTHCSLEEYPVSYYIDFLEYIKSKYAGQYWHVLPRELARFWRTTILFNEIKLNTSPR